MSEQPRPVARQPLEKEGDLWARVRESLERLAAIRDKQADPAVLAEKRAARAKQWRSRVTTAVSSETPLVHLAFRKGDQRYAVPVENVIEIQALDQFSPVPGTPPFIPGVIHWRGDVLCLLDIGKLFAIPESGIADTQVCLIVEAAGHRLAIVALEIEEIYSVFRSEIKPSPALPDNIPAEWIIGVHDDNRVILQLDNLVQDARFVNWRQ